jgi:hypothetical protein
MGLLRYAEGVMKKKVLKEPKHRAKKSTVKPKQEHFPVTVEEKAKIAKVAATKIFSKNMWLKEIVLNEVDRELRKLGK